MKTGPTRGNQPPPGFNGRLITATTTIRLVDASFDNEPVLTLLTQTANEPEETTDPVAQAKQLSNLDRFAQATNPRVLAEHGRNIQTPAGTLTRNNAMYRNVINSAFTNPAGASEGGARFNHNYQGTWYASENITTASAEVQHHRHTRLRTRTPTLPATQFTYKAWSADFHDIHLATLNKNSMKHFGDNYIESQRYADLVRNADLQGIMYPSARGNGNNIACFQADLVRNVHPAGQITMQWDPAPQTITVPTHG